MPKPFPHTYATTRLIPEPCEVQNWEVQTYLLIYLSFDFMSNMSSLGFPDTEKPPKRAVVPCTHVLV